MKHGLYTISTLAAFMAIASSPAAAQNASSIWKDAVKKCAASALQGSGTVFLGLSSNYAPGTVFARKARGRVQIQRRASEYITDQDRAAVINVNPPTSCAAVSQKSFRVGVTTDLTQLGVPANIGIDVARARSVSIQPTTVAWEDLVLGPYEDLVSNRAPAPIRQNLLVDHMPVLSRAVRVDGIKTVLKFDNSTGTTLSVKPIPLGIDAKWTSSTELTISSTATFYIAGQLSSFNYTSLQSTNRFVLKRDDADTSLQTSAN